MIKIVLIIAAGVIPVAIYFITRYLLSNEFTEHDEHYSDLDNYYEH